MLRSTKQTSTNQPIQPNICALCVCFLIDFRTIIFNLTIRGLCYTAYSTNGNSIQIICYLKLSQWVHGCVFKVILLWLYLSYFIFHILRVMLADNFGSVVTKRCKKEKKKTKNVWEIAFFCTSFVLLSHFNFHLSNQTPIGRATCVVKFNPIKNLLNFVLGMKEFDGIELKWIENWRTPIDPLHK